MKNTSLICLLLLGLFACDTTAKQSNTLAEQPSNNTYVSPPVLVERAALPPPLPADSIPVQYGVKGIANAPADFVPMMGKWVSAYDEDESVLFTPGQYTSYYKGEKVVEEHMVYYRVCPESCMGDKPSNSQACFVLASPYGQTCFAIVSHSEQRLELSLLGAEENNVLTYIRN
jgi:hypothetical protein